MTYDLVVVGGGAAGFFASIRLAELKQGAKICIVEAARKPLSKVEISGGGRCNVTHACFDPKILCTYYPRGKEELQGPFTQYQPKDIVEWFLQKGVRLKKESDGRMFPVTDSSSTIIDCFMKSIKKSGIDLLTSTRVNAWKFDEQLQTWRIELFDGEMLLARNLLIATGSDNRTWDQLALLGHRIISPVPSLFTFNIRDPNLVALQGVSRNSARLSIPDLQLSTEGPLLITHWGLSGPAILKLSAWGARELYNCGYVFDLVVNWKGDLDRDEFRKWLQASCQANIRKQIYNLVVPDFPTRLWKYFCVRAEIPELTNGAEIGNKKLDRLADVVCKDLYRVTGKSTFKDEFVTAGGVDLDDMNMGQFQSKKNPHLYLAGEVLNIDALTGGFNFQAAWTGAEMVARELSKPYY